MRGYNNRMRTELMKTVSCQHIIPLCLALGLYIIHYTGTQVQCVSGNIPWPIHYTHYCVQDWRPTPACGRWSTGRAPWCCSASRTRAGTDCRPGSGRWGLSMYCVILICANLLLHYIFIMLLVTKANMVQRMHIYCLYSVYMIYFTFHPPPFHSQYFFCPYNKD